MARTGWRGSVSERFWSKVRRTRGCWLWIGAKTAQGYGSLRVAGRSVLAHRYAYELKHGPIPPNIFVMHRCDVRACVRHLQAGTNQDNMLDAASKGRLYSQRGWCNPKLSPSSKRRIFRLAPKMSQARIARLFGVHQSQISRVLNGRTFKYAGQVALG